MANATCLTPPASARRARNGNERNEAGDDVPRVDNLFDLERRCDAEKPDHEFWRCLAIAAAVELTTFDPHAEPLALVYREPLPDWQQALQCLMWRRSEHRELMTDEHSVHRGEMCDLHDGAEEDLAAEINLCFARMFADESCVPDSQPSTLNPQPIHFSPETLDLELPPYGSNSPTEIPMTATTPTKKSKTRQPPVPKSAARSTAPAAGVSIPDQVRRQQARRGHVASDELTPDLTSTTLPSGIAYQTADAACRIEPAQEIALELIDDSPYQTREEASDAWIAEVMESLRTVGQTTSCLVRPSPTKPGRWEFIAGHTRGRAARRLKWTTLRCEIARNCDDVTAAALVLIENDKRRELTVIDKAKGLQRVREVYAAEGKTQAELARAVNLAESTISNQLRLLSLPEEWQRRLLAGELHIDHARQLARWGDRPKVFDGFKAYLKNCGCETGPIDTHHFKASLWQGIKAASRIMTKHGYGESCDFTPTAAEKQELDIEVVPTNYGAKQSRAFNIKLWNKLQKAARAKQKQKQKTAAAAKSGGPKAPTAPVIESYKLYRLWGGWFQRRIAERLKGKLTKAQREQLWKAVLIVQSDGFVDDCCAAFGLRHTWQERHLSIRAILATPLERIQEALIDHWIKQFNNTDDAEVFAHVAEAQAIGEVFGVTLTEWEPDAPFLDELQPDVLTSLAIEQSIQVEADKAKQVATLVELWRPGVIPEVLDVFPKPAKKKTSKAKK